MLAGLLKPTQLTKKNTQKRLSPAHAANAAGSARVFAQSAQKHGENQTIHSQE
jgi:hypothetical protein